MTFRRLLLVVLLSILIGWGWLVLKQPVIQAQPATPALPSNIQATGLPVLLDFYATWCGTCQWMKPYVDSLEHRFAKRLKVVHIDVDQQPDLAKRFHIEGTPTYYLYNGQHQPVYRMNRYLVPQVLKAEVYRVTGETPSTPPPASLITLAPHRLTWVRMIDVSQPLPTLRELPVGLVVKTVPVHQPSLAAWLKQLDVPDHAGSNVLLDDKGRVLFKATSQTKPSVVQDFLKLFASGELLS